MQRAPPPAVRRGGRKMVMRWLIAVAVAARTASSGRLTHNFKPPLRGWAFPWNPGGNGAVLNTTAEPWAKDFPPPSALYPAGAVNFVPTSQIMWNDQQFNTTAGMSLSWGYCWDSPWVSKANGSVSNATAVADYFADQASTAFGLGERPGTGLDECNSGNEAVKGEKQAAAAGFRAARARYPNLFLAAWGANAGDDIFASLMRDGE